MIDAIKRSPGKYNYASVGSGSPHHLFMESLKTEYGLEIQHVPYKGTPAALTDLLSGAIQVMFADATIAVPNTRAGKVIALGTSAARPTTLLPDVPPIANTVPWFRLAGVAGDCSAGRHAERDRRAPFDGAAANSADTGVQGPIV